MKTYEETAQSVLERINRTRAERKKRKKAAARIAVSAAGVCAAVLLGVGALRPGLYESDSPAAGEEIPAPEIRASSEYAAPERPEEVAERREAPSAPEAQPVPEEEKKGAEPAGGFSYLLWNGLKVGGTLKLALESSPGEKLTVLASFRPTTGNVTSFLYEGKTLADWAIEAFAEDADLTAKGGYKRAYNAYLERVLPETVSALTECGIACERTAYRNDALTLRLTSEELQSLPLESPTDWCFELASDGLKDAPVSEPDAIGKAVN